MKPTDIDTNGMFKLFDAITVLACRDYVKAKKLGDDVIMASIESFFKSDWGHTVSRVDPEYALRKLGSMNPDDILRHDAMEAI